jgi:hypothetical protein
MAIEDYPLVDTTFVDSLVSSYALTQPAVSPIELLDLTENDCTVDEEMLGLIKYYATLSLAGKAVIASAQFAIGIDDINKMLPSISVADGACGFVGRFVDIAICDFTDAAYKAQVLPDSEHRVLLPGMVFETDHELEDFASSLGVVSLAPYCAVLPGSPYSLRHIRFAA